MSLPLILPRVTTTECDNAVIRLEQELLRDIPLARAMQLHIEQFDSEVLTLSVPLAPNINDKGCAFGGSLASLLTLTGWSLVVLKLRQVGIECDVFVQDSTIRYQAPVWENFCATAVLAEGENWGSFFTSLNLRKRGRLRLSCRVPLRGGENAVAMEARFVAKVRTAQNSKKTE